MQLNATENTDADTFCWPVLVKLVYVNNMFVKHSIFVESWNYRNKHNMKEEGTF